MFKPITYIAFLILTNILNLDFPNLNKLNLENSIQNSESVLSCFSQLNNTGYRDHTSEQPGYDMIKLSDLDNRIVTLSEFSKNNSILLISFWATWCKPCMEELNAINEKLENWKSEVDFQFIAISIDDARSGSKIKSVVNGKDWNFPVLKDGNQNLKRYFNISNIPAMILIKNGEIKYKSTGYTPGNEDFLFKEIHKLNE